MASEAIVSALAALGGAVVGASASVLNASRTAARERARQLSLDRRRYQDLPILESRTGSDGQLLELLDEVRQALGDRWGIWEAIQDSIGSHAALPDGRVISYPEFCGQLSDPNDYIWFLRLIDFYHGVCNDEKAPTRHHPVIRRGIEALDNLLVAIDAGRVRRAKPHPSRPAPTHD